MQLSSTLSWLVDAASEAPGADRLLAELGARLVADGLPHRGQPDTRRAAPARLLDWLCGPAGK
jgi:hypothetical protein